jgi:hypothetical protein
LTLDEIEFILDVLASFYYDVIIESKFAADESIFSSTPDLSFIFSSTPDLSILFTSEVLFLEYFEFYQHSTPVVSSNQIRGILEAFNNIQLLTSDEVDLLIYQPRECDIHRIYLSHTYPFILWISLIG